MHAGYKSETSIMLLTNDSYNLHLGDCRCHTVFRMPFARWLLSIVLLVLISRPALAEKVLFTAEYAGSYSGMTIKSTRRLIEQDDGQFRFESTINNAFASIIETSRFDLKNGMILPLRYHYKRNVLSFKADESIDFDWHDDVAKYRRKKKARKNRDFEISPGTLDPALYQLQLQRDLFSHRSELVYRFVKSNKVKTLELTTRGEEKVSVGNKSYQAIKVEQQPLDGKEETQLWIAPQLDYQIARIEHSEENGETYNIYLKSYTSSPDLLDIFYRSNPSPAQAK